MKDLYVVILAGGRGERLWPLSRKNNPKQFLKIFKGKSLFQLTLERAKLLTDKIIILTTREQLRILKKQLKSKAKILVEPQPRNTSASLALAISYIYAHQPSSLMLVLPSDHFIPDLKLFKDKMIKSYNFLKKEGKFILTFGIKPSHPATGYGYIEAGERINNQIYKVTRFIEKPNKERAINFLRRKNFFFNCGIFFWNTETILKTYQKISPSDFDIMKKMIKLFSSNYNEDKLNSLFAKLRPISIDYAIMEKSKNLAVMKANFKWDDLGSFVSLANYLPQDEKGNVCFGSNKVLKYEVKDSLIFNLTSTPLVLQNINNLIICMSKDVVYISQKQDSNKVKLILPEVSKRKWEKII